MISTCLRWLTQTIFASATGAARTLRAFADRLLVLTAFLALICGAAAFNVCKNSNRGERLPGLFPVVLNERGVIFNRQISVIDHAGYYFSLRFTFDENDPADRERVSNLVGSSGVSRDDEPLDRGISLPLSISIFKREGEYLTGVFCGEVDPVLTSWGGDNFSKQIEHIELAPGEYLVKLTLLEETSAFSGTPVAFGIGYDRFKARFNLKSKSFIF